MRGFSDIVVEPGGRRVYDLTPVDPDNEIVPRFNGYGGVFVCDGLEAECGVSIS